MLKVRDIMTTDPITAHPDEDIGRVAKLLLEEHINGVPVTDRDNTLVGILTQSDLVAMQKKFPLPTVFTLLDGILPLSSLSRMEKEVEKMTASTVDQAMTSDPVSVAPETSVEEVAQLMADNKFHTLPVVDNGELVGVIGKEDVLRTLYK
ncbi:MAG: CBS domain-containing protein [Desulfonatronovibrionaceae bacterium]